MGNKRFCSSFNDYDSGFPYFNHQSLAIKSLFSYPELNSEHINCFIVQNWTISIWHPTWNNQFNQFTNIFHKCKKDENADRWDIVNSSRNYSETSQSTLTFIYAPSYRCITDPSTTSVFLSFSSTNSTHSLVLCQWSSTDLINTYTPSFLWCNTFLAIFYT